MDREFLEQYLPNEPQARRRGAVWGVLAGAVTGAAAMYLFDPNQGRRRRALARDKIIKLRNMADRTFTEDIPRRVNYVSGFAEGAKHHIVEAMDGEAIGADNEHVLIDRVMSIVFRDPEFPKGKVNVDASGSTVYLRGKVDGDQLREQIEERVRGVEGVGEVINLINEPEVDPSEIR